MTARRNYQEQLDALRADVRRMADAVLDRYDDALEAYRTTDADLAAAVVEGDHEINQLYLDIEEDCVDLLALQQPVASDLRFVASSFKIVTDLERIADLSTNLATYGTDGGQPLPTSTVAELGGLARGQVVDAIDAYEAGDADDAWTIAARDDDLDSACEVASERVVRDLLDRDGSADAEPLVEEVSRALLTIRDIERIGDHAVNICARTLYAVEADEGLLY